MGFSLAKFLHSLANASNSKSHWAAIDAWAREGLSDRLYEVAVALHEQTSNDAIQASMESSVFERIVGALTQTPRADFAETALMIAALACKSPGRKGSGVPLAQKRCCETAQRLAAGHPPDSLLPLFVKYADDPRYYEPLVCLLQQMVVQGYRAQEAEALRAFHAVLVDRQHPLSWLPLSLTPLEAGITAYLPRYSPSANSYAIPFGPVDSAPAQPAANPQASAAAAAIDAAPWICSDTTTPAEAERMATAVQNWEQESNGRIEAKILQGDRPLAPREVTAPFLLSLPLECLAGAGIERIYLRIVSPESAMTMLFAAAATGGAYNSGRFGAYGRLEAWRSLAALAGVAPDEDFEAILQQAQTCLAWGYFVANSPWFAQVAWDIGLLALRPNGDKLAILAATDTD